MQDYMSGKGKEGKPCWRKQGRFTKQKVVKRMGAPEMHREQDE